MAHFQKDAKKNSKIWLNISCLELLNTAEIRKSFTTDMDSVGHRKNRYRPWHFYEIEYVQEFLVVINFVFLSQKLNKIIEIVYLFPQSFNYSIDKFSLQL